MVDAMEKKSLFPPVLLVFSEGTKPEESLSLTVVRDSDSRERSGCM